MTESTARAERIQAPPSRAACYTWEVAQKPVSVRIPFDLIDRLEREVGESFRSLTSRGSEIGGLLVGSVSAGSPAVVSIESYELIPCDYSRGPLYHLSDADLGRLERAVEQRATDGAEGVVGFFRSHTRKGLALDAEDVALFEARFRDPHHVALLVRPFATKASVAGIFIWEEGTVRMEASHLEFPFRSAQLTREAQAGGGTLEASHPAPVVPAPVAPKPAARAQVVPIASRREIALPVPMAATPQERPPEAEAATRAAVAPEPAAAPSRSPEPAVPAAAVEQPVSETVVKARAVEPQAEPWTAHESSSLLSPEPEAGGSKKKTILVGSVAAAALAAFVLLFVYPGLLHRGSQPAPAAPMSRQDSSPLSLRVERAAGELLVTWNREAPVIQTARSAQLSISDGQRHETYDMDIDQLRKGSIVYEPLTPDVSFRMEVVGQKQDKTASEMVRVLRNSPMPGDVPVTAATGASKTEPAATPPASAAATPEEAVPAGRPMVPRKPFQVESLAERLRPARATDLPDAPSLGASSASALDLNTMAPGLSSPLPAQRAPAPPPVEKKAPSGGHIQQAEVLSRTSPVYPRLAQQAGVRGAVELMAIIGPDGRVRSVRIIKGHPMLQQAAIDSVMKWTYKPALLNGTAVESQMQVRLDFVAR